MVAGSSPVTPIFLLKSDFRLLFSPHKSTAFHTREFFVFFLIKNKGIFLVCFRLILLRTFSTFDMNRA